MNIPGFSTNALLMMYGGVRDALAVDDNTQAGQAKPYGARSFADWRIHSSAIEAELDSREVAYSKIQW